MFVGRIYRDCDWIVLCGSGQWGGMCDLVGLPSISRDA